MMATKSWAKRLRLRVDTEDPIYRGMKKLKLSGKELARIPRELFTLLELEVLDLSPEREACLNYRLLNIPIEISRLINLRVIMLDTNDLKDVPAEFALLHNLERVALSNNALSSLPSEFGTMKKLKSLHCANNCFSLFPEVICQIEGLEFVDFSDNEIKVIPDAIDKLKNLESLLMMYNKLDRLPDNLCNLSQLNTLWLGGNQLRRLPRHFGKLSNLLWGIHYTSAALDGNPLVHPTLDICRQGPEYIARYFEMNGRKKEKRKESVEKPEPNHVTLNDKNKTDDVEY